jgi:hypothetical protein
MQTHKQTDRQTYRHTDRHTDRHTRSMHQVILFHCFCLHVCGAWSMDRQTKYIWSSHRAAVAFLHHHVIVACISCDLRAHAHKTTGEKMGLRLSEETHLKGASGTCTRLPTAILIKIEGQCQIFERFSCSKLVLNTVESRYSTRSYCED